MEMDRLAFALTDAAAVESQPSSEQPAIDEPPEQQADDRLESWKPDGQRKAA